MAKVTTQPTAKSDRHKLKEGVWKPYNSQEPKGNPGTYTPMQHGIALIGLVFEMKTGMKMSRAISAADAAKNMLGYLPTQRPSKCELYDRLLKIVELNDEIMAAEKVQTNPILN